MVELLRSNDVVLLSWVTALLKDAGIEAIVLDLHMSFMEGSIGALPRRMMIHDDDAAAARRLLDQADVDYVGRE